MANLFQALANIRKYGLKPAITGALQTPGGFLDNTASNPNVQWMIDHPSQPGSRAAGQSYYDPATQSYKPFPTLVSDMSAGTTDNGGGGGWPADAPAAPAPQDPSAGGGGTGTGGYVPNLVEYPQGSGFYYDLNDDTQRGAFYNRRLVDLQAARDEQISTIDQNIADLIGSSKDYVKNYFKQLEGLTNAKGIGDTNRIDTFSSASPNAFQSSEADSFDLANKGYLRGVGDAATQANEAVGANYLANPEDTSLLGADTIYGRQLADYQSGRNQVGNQFNDMYAGIQQQNDPSTNPFRFDYQAAGLKTPGAVDLSGYNPFVDFKTIPGTAQPGAGFKPAGGLGFTDQTPLDNFLGKTQVNAQDKDFLRSYLLGKA